MQFLMLLVIVKWLCSTVQHTSASLTINENYDSDVQADTETFLSQIVPEVNVVMFLFVSVQGDLIRMVS